MMKLWGILFISIMAIWCFVRMVCRYEVKICRGYTPIWAVSHEISESKHPSSAVRKIMCICWVIFLLP